MIEYLKRFLDNYDSGASLRNAMFALVVVATVFYLFLAMAYNMATNTAPFDTQWNVALGLIVSAVTSSKIAGQKILAQSDKDKAAAGDIDAAEKPVVQE